MELTKGTTSHQFYSDREQKRRFPFRLPLSRVKTANAWRIALMVFAIALLSASMSAQVLYGSLTGTVTDASGAVIVGAQVTASEGQTGVSQNAVSDSSGIYRSASLLPGTYKVT